MYTNKNTGRVPEILDTLKSEYDTLSKEIDHYKLQRDEYERRLQIQVKEVSVMQAIVADLESRYLSLQRKYEEELKRVQNSTGETEPHSKFREQTQQSMMTKFPSIKPNANLHTFPRSEGTERSERGFPGGLSAQSNLLGKRSPGDSENGTRLSPLNQIPSIPPNKIQKPEGDISAFASRASKQNSFADSPHGMTISNSGILPAPRKMIQEQEPSRGSRAPFSPDVSPRDESHRPPAPAERSPPSDVVVPAKGVDDFRVAYNPLLPTSTMKIKLVSDYPHSSVVCCVRFSQDGQFLATGANRKAQIFSVASGDCVATFSEAEEQGTDLYLRSVSFSPDAKYLACGAEDKTVKLWEIEKNQVAHIFKGHSMDIYSVDYSNDGRYVVSGSGDKTARVWDVQEKKCVFVLGNDEVGPKDGVTSVAISPDGRLVAAGSLDKVIRLWDMQTGYFLERYEGHADSVYSVAFSPDGKCLASGSLDRTLKIWDFSESRSRSRCRTTFNGHTDFVLSVAFSPNGNWLVSGSKDRSVQFWDPRSAITHLKLEGHKNSVISVAVNSDNSTFASGSGDHRAKLWRYS